MYIAHIFHHIYYEVRSYCSRRHALQSSTPSLPRQGVLPFFAGHFWQNIYFELFFCRSTAEVPFFLFTTSDMAASLLARSSSSLAAKNPTVIGPYPLYKFFPFNFPRRRHFLLLHFRESRQTWGGGKLHQLQQPGRTRSNYKMGGRGRRNVISLPPSQSFSVHPSPPNTASPSMCGPCTRTRWKSWVLHPSRRGEKCTSVSMGKETSAFPYLWGDRFACLKCRSLFFLSLIEFGTRSVHVKSMRSLTWARVEEGPANFRRETQTRPCQSTSPSVHRAHAWRECASEKNTHARALRHARTHGRTHARTHAHTHTVIYSPPSPWGSMSRLTRMVNTKSTLDCSDFVFVVTTVMSKHDSCISWRLNFDHSYYAGVAVGILVL